MVNAFEEKAFRLIIAQPFSWVSDKQRGNATCKAATLITESAAGKGAVLALTEAG